MKPEGVCAFALMLTLSAFAEDNGIREAIHSRSAGSMIEESTAVEWATVQARNSSDTRMELRPSFSETEGGLALRFYLPNRGLMRNLRDQLSLAMQAELLRVDELEWQELISVYRDFCSYRWLNKQRGLYAQERAFLKPLLKQADDSVQAHQLAVSERAKLYALYLDLQNQCDELELDQIRVRRQLQSALGESVDLEALAAESLIKSPTRLELDTLLVQALKSRADYRLMETDVRSLAADEESARAQEGFQLKYIQTGYEQDISGGDDSSWQVSAAFVLPWGNKNSDVAMFRKQQLLAQSNMALQRQLLSERFQGLIKTANLLAEKMTHRIETVQPLIEQLHADLNQMAGEPLVEARNQLALREQILKSALQTAQIEYERERLAVDFIEEVGALSIGTD